MQAILKAESSGSLLKNRYLYGSQISGDPRKLVPSFIVLDFVARFALQTFDQDVANVCLEPEVELL